MGGLLCQCRHRMLESPRPDSCTMTRAKAVPVPSAGGPAWGCATRAVARSGRLGHRAPDADQSGVGTEVSHSVPTVALLVSSPPGSRHQIPGPLLKTTLLSWHSGVRTRGSSPEPGLPASTAAGPIAAALLPHPGPFQALWTRHGQHADPSPPWGGPSPSCRCSTSPLGLSALPL